MDRSIGVGSIIGEIEGWVDCSIVVPCRVPVGGVRHDFVDLSIRVTDPRNRDRLARRQGYNIVPR